MQEVRVFGIRKKKVVVVLLLWSRVSCAIRVTLNTAHFLTNMYLLPLQKWPAIIFYHSLSIIILLDTSSSKFDKQNQLKQMKVFVCTNIWCGLIISTTGTPAVWVRQHTSPGCCGTSLHWHSAADCELLLLPELLFKVTGNNFLISFWSLTHGATNVFPTKHKKKIQYNSVTTLSHPSPLSKVSNKS